jgi:hypothetical protein
MLKLTFSIPPTLNAQIKAARGSKIAAARKKRELTQAIQSYCAQVALIPGIKQEGRVWIGLEWNYFNDAIDPLDNLPASLKPILDGLVKSGILQDDSSKIIRFPLHSIRVKDKSNTVTLHIFDHYEEYKEWVLKNL